jgi:hypothetical protein
VMNADGTGQTRLTTDAAYDGTPAWGTAAAGEPEPTNAFVTGGGWIRSPAGAYATGPRMTGRVTFAFASQYRDGATVPTGRTQFGFQAPGLTFRSTRYDSLVIADATARYGGTGTINGRSGYGFLLTAVDGRATGAGGHDLLRLKIWNRATGAIIYDNQRGAPDTAAPTTAIGGGSIIVRAR